MQGNLVEVNVEFFLNQLSFALTRSAPTHDWQRLGLFPPPSLSDLSDSVGLCLKAFKTFKNNRKKVLVFPLPPPGRSGPFFVRTCFDM
jgi:hypothetical protein